MYLGQLHITHWNLRNPAQINEMVETILSGGFLPPIHLLELPDGTILIQDGHHRSLAYWLSGRERLEYGEYILYQVDQSNRHPRGSGLGGTAARGVSCGTPCDGACPPQTGRGKSPEL